MSLLPEDREGESINPGCYSRIEVKVGVVEVEEIRDGDKTKEM